MARRVGSWSKPIIGLAGGIGAGKSVVASMLESLGSGVIDSDRVGHELLDDPDVIAAIVGWWGDSVVASAGRLDRRAIAKIVFADASELKRLEGLLYPRIEQRRESVMADFDADESIRAIVLDAPKLYEAQLDALCDAVIFVKTLRESRVARVVASRGWTETQLAKRENLQKPLDMKEASADHVIENNSGLDSLRLQVERVFSSIMTSRG